MKRVAIGGLHTECSSYSPLEQTAADFVRIKGHELCELVPFDFAAAGIELVPLFHDRSVPGGPVSATTFEAQTSDFMTLLEAAMPLDGLLLLMHGAMFVPGIDDPEGAFIAQVREIVGTNTIISGAFDLHGQMTATISETLDAFAAYRTAPHIDVAETYTRAAQMLAKALNGGPRPVVCWEPVPILVPGEMLSTFAAPCDGLYAQLPLLDESPGVCDSNLMIGYVWADSPRATAAAVVTALDVETGQQTAKRIARSYHEVRDSLTFDMAADSLESTLDRLAGQAAILADSGDNPTAGGVGDRAEVLAAVQNSGIKNALFAGIADPLAYAQLEIGSDRVTIGGSLGGGGPQVSLDIHNCRIAEECAVLQSNDTTIVISRKRRPFHNISDFQMLGLELDDYPLLVVKSGYLSPELRRLPRKQMMALTGGAVCQDLASLENTFRPKGTWPFSKFGNE